MAVAKGLKVVGYFDCAGGGQVVVRNNVAYVGHVKPPNGTTIIDVSDPAKPRELAQIKVPEGTLSHKVRVENGVMLVNREVFPIGRIDPDFKGGLEVFDVSNPSKPTPHHHLGVARHAPLHVRRPLRLRLAGARRLSRQCRLDHRFPESGKAAGSRPLVDAGAMDRRRRKADLGRHRAPLPSSDARRQPALHQLLARRLRHPRHRRHHQAEIRLGPRLEPALSLADAHRAAGAVSVARAARHAGRRRGRRASPRPARRRPSCGWSTSPTKHRPIPFASFQVAEEDGSPKQDYTGLHQFCEEIRSNRNSDRVVCARAARRRHRKSARAAAKSLRSCRTCRKAPSACRATTCASTTAA